MSLQSEPTGGSHARSRIEMVSRQLSARGLADKRVLDAMRSVPRELFVEPSESQLAYADQALAIGYGQTISQPYTVASMCESGRVRPGDNVLDVGTGSGYAAAVLSHLAATVHTVERIPDLAVSARERLTSLGYGNVISHVGDGSLGWPDTAPYDVIMVAAGTHSLPLDYIDQLRDGGRIVIPIGQMQHGQTMFRFTRHGRELSVEPIGSFSFVPLIGEHGWSTDDDFESNASPST